MGGGRGGDRRMPPLLTLGTLQPESGAVPPSPPRGVDGRPSPRPLSWPVVTALRASPPPPPRFFTLASFLPLKPPPRDCLFPSVGVVDGVGRCGSPSPPTPLGRFDQPRLLFFSEGPWWGWQGEGGGWGRRGGRPGSHPAARIAAGPSKRSLEVWAAGGPWRGAGAALNVRPPSPVPHPPRNLFRGGGGPRAARGRWAAVGCVGPLEFPPLPSHSALAPLCLFRRPRRRPSHPPLPFATSPLFSSYFASAL